MRSIEGKIVTAAQAAARADEARIGGETVVMCHGCFDLLHRGHRHHLRQASRLGDRLLVTVTADAFVNKGAGRPLVTQERRLRALAGLSCVDWVAICPHPTAEELLAAVRPDVFVKGREYEKCDDPRFAAERQVVLRHGGRVAFTSGDLVFSSTAIINAMRRKNRSALVVRVAGADRQ